MVRLKQKGDLFPASSGVHRSFVEFSHMAQQSRRPYEGLKNLPGVFNKSLYQHLSQTPDMVTQSRIINLSEWANRARALNTLEEQLTVREP